MAMISLYSPSIARAYTLVPQLGQKAWGKFIVPKRYSCQFVRYQKLPLATRGAKRYDSNLDSILTVVERQIGNFNINQEIAVDATDGTCIKSDLALSGLIFNDPRLSVSPRGNLYSCMCSRSAPV